MQKIAKDILQWGKEQARNYISDSSGAGPSISKSIMKAHFLYVPFKYKL